MTTELGPALEARLWRTALTLALLTVFYNLLEGVVSVAYGIQDESLSLLGFGLDSFIETISGVGILAMVLRIQRHPETSRSVFERNALRVTGSAFYLLTIGLIGSAVYNVASGHVPETTVPGVLISIVSVGAMWFLVREKRKTGIGLSCAPILADAQCTMVCIYMSLVLLGASLIYAVTGIGFVDSLGAFGLAYLSWNEGRESFEKAAAMHAGAGEEAG